MKIETLNEVMLASANQRRALVELANEIPELLADYEHCALDADGHLDPHRKKRIEKIRALLGKVKTS